MMLKRLLPEETGAPDKELDWRALLAHFLQILPPKLKAAFDQPDPFLQVLFGADEISINAVRHQQAEPLLRVAISNPDEAAALSQKDFSLISSYPKTVSVLLPQSDCLHRTIDMPFAKRSALKAALAFELERVSPIDPTRVYFDFQVLARDPKTTKSKIDLRIVKRESVDHAVDWCREAGLRVGSVGFAAESKNAHWSSFPIDRRSLFHLIWLRWSIPILAGAAVFLFILVLFTAYARGVATQARIQSDIDAERSRAALSSRIEAEIRQTAAQAEFLQHQKQAPAIVAIASDLTSALPNSTWLNELQVNGRHVRIQGYSKSASDLISILEKTGKFSNAQFAAPLTHTNDTDRFDLSIDWYGARP